MADLSGYDVPRDDGGFWRTVDNVRARKGWKLVTLNHPGLKVEVIRES